MSEPFPWEQPQNVFTIYNKIFWQSCVPGYPLGLPRSAPALSDDESQGVYTFSVITTKLSLSLQLKLLQVSVY